MGMEKGRPHIDRCTCKMKVDTHKSVGVYFLMNTEKGGIKMGKKGVLKLTFDLLYDTTHSSRLISSSSDLSFMMILRCPFNMISPSSCNAASLRLKVS